MKLTPAQRHILLELSHRGRDSRTLRKLVGMWRVRFYFAMADLEDLGLVETRQDIETIGDIPVVVRTYSVTRYGMGVFRESEPTK